MAPSKHIRLLVINPNTSVSITESLKPVVSSLSLSNTAISYWTLPTGPAILKSQADIYDSANNSLPLLLEIADEYDGFLIACYADHPLTSLLRKYVGYKPVVGIFEASITTALHSLVPDSRFGIVTTGVAYEAMLSEGVRRFFGVLDSHTSSDLTVFGGVSASGIGLDDISGKARKAAKSKLMEATRRLVRRGDISVICMGGVLLAGMEDCVREACVEELGVELGTSVKVVDQMMAGIVTLEGLVKIRC